MDYYTTCFLKLLYYFISLKVYYKNEDISGYYPPDSEERNPVAVKTENDASYKINLGISGDRGSSGSGSSSGTGSVTTTKLRLVE